MPEITIHEGEAAKYEFPLTYSYRWSSALLRGTNVTEDQTDTVYFYAKTNKSDATAWLTLTDASPTQISWSGNVVTVHFPPTTEGKAGVNYWELRIEWPDGTFLTAADGVLNIKESIVDTPA